MVSELDYAFLSALAYNDKRSRFNKTDELPQWESIGPGSPLSSSARRAN